MRGEAKLKRTLGFCAPRPLPAVAGAKTKNFPSLISDFRRGVWGEPTKNGKEIFGFASPFQSPKRALLFYKLLFALFSVLTARRGASSPRLVITLNSAASFTGRDNSKYGLCWAQTNLYVLDPPSRSRTNPCRF